jgi:2-polyprenyl-3-methyl-5-hydroxy-6-metoxy-1,4-benzoquinol methylase
MIERTSIADIQAATNTAIDNISEHDRDEMAIPSYLHSNPLIRLLMWKRYDTVSEMLIAGSDKQALEFGCGVGLFLSHLCANYSQVFALDLFPQYAQALMRQKNLAPNFIQHLNDIEDGSLDTIVAADVLEHIEELDEYLALFHRKLKTDGQLLVSGPTENVLYKLGRQVAGFGDKGDYHHTNIDNLIAAISNAGFHCLETKKLPFPVLPGLFKICHFHKTSG